MGLITFTFSWMLYNTFLAILPVIFAWIFLSVRSKFLKIIFGFAWIAFLPNTIYVVTDLVHFPGDWASANLIEKVILLGQYGALQVIGLVTFILALYPFEKILKKSKKKYWNNPVFTIVILNFFIGFGIVLGRVERINSWEIFTHTARVMVASFTIFTTTELIDMVILFGIFANLSYFLLRKTIIVKVHKSFKKYF